MVAVGDGQLGVVAFREPQESVGGIESGKVVFGLIAEGVSAVGYGDLIFSGVLFHHLKQIFLQGKDPVIETTPEIQHLDCFGGIPQSQGL